MAGTGHNSMRNRQTLEAYKRKAIEQARASLMGFTLYTNPRYETGWFYELLSAELDQFLLDVEAGDAAIYASSSISAPVYLSRAIHYLP